MCQKARARVSDERMLQLFDLLDEVYAREWRERYAAWRKGDLPSSGYTRVIAKAESEPPGERLRRFLVSGVRRVRAMTWLVASYAAEAATRPETAMLMDGPRLTKAAVGEALALAATCDRELETSPAAVLVPFRGRGAFLWDQDLLLLALRPSVGAEDSVATALASYRMLADHLNRGGQLRAEYEKRFPGANFRVEFPADYRLWLCRVARGDFKAMPPARRAFFRDFVGPDCSGILAPANLRNLGPQTRLAIRSRLEKQMAVSGGDANLLRRLAVLLWQDGDLGGAAARMAEASAKAPADGEILLSLGLLHRSRGDDAGATEAFRQGVERAGGTIWALYCQDAMENEI